MKKILPLIILIIIIAGGAYWYNQQPTKSNSSPNPNQHPTPTKKQEVIKIGAILPLSGKLSIIGTPEKDAINTFLKKNGDMKVHYEDFASDTKNVTTVFNKLHRVDGINVIYTSTSPASNALKSLKNTNNFLLISNTSQKGVADKNNLIFQVAPITEDEIDLLSEKGLFTENAELLVPNNELGINMKQKFVNTNPDVLFNIQTFEIGQRDFKIEISKLSRNAKVVVFQGYPGDIPVFLKQLQEINKNVERVILPMSAVWLPFSTYKEQSFEIIFPVPSVYESYLKGDESSNKELAYLIEAYEETYNKPINYDVLFVWQALDIMRHAYKKSLDNSSIFEEEMKKIWLKGSFNGILGKIKMNPSGDIYSPMSIMKFDARKL